ncbi:unnamed protein product [Kluyveromyces dobzhanskii CBS 2104]|nr:unnamed protein product [Kluyveromyces dobzhanskii CBS 2104]
MNAMQNGLAGRLGIFDRDREPRAKDRGRGGNRSKRAFNDRRKKITLLRIKNIPLETSDYEIEDWLNEIGEVESVRINDKKENRVATVGFKDPQLLGTAAEKLNGKEVHGVQLEVETFEVGAKNPSSGQSYRGNATGAQSGVASTPANASRKSKPEPKTKEELDQEMEDYMNQN